MLQAADVTASTFSDKEAAGCLGAYALNLALGRSLLSITVILTKRGLNFSRRCCMGAKLSLSLWGRNID
jgi:hypothetical protein